MKEEILKILKEELMGIPIYSSMGDIVDIEIKGIEKASLKISHLFDHEKEIENCPCHVMIKTFNDGVILPTECTCKLIIDNKAL